MKRARRPPRLAMILIICAGAVCTGLLAHPAGHLLKACLFTILDSTAWTRDGTTDARARLPWTTVAHAGGAIGGLACTNSLDALEANYSSGCRVFEFDFELTSDGQIVLLHDWNDRWAALHPGSPRCGRRDLRTFLSEPMRHGLHPLSWHMLAQWMRVHQDALVIADAKTRTLHILGEMAQQRDLVPKVIPQIFGLREYRHVRALGYDRIFLTLYRRDYLTSALIRFVRTCPVAAVVCTPERARRSGLARRLGLEGVPVFVHTVNSHEQHERSRGDGAWGIYTDSLLP